MRHLLTILSLTILISCKTEYRKIIDSYPNGKVKVEYVYPDKDDKSKYAIIEYFENGQILFKGTVKNNKFIGTKMNYYDNGNLKEIDSLLEPAELENCDCNAKVFKYNSRGILIQSFECRKELPSTRVIFYDDSTGKLDIIYTFVGVMKNGLYTKYYKSGKVYSIGTYKNDTLSGYQYFFKENGDSLKYNFTYKGNLDFPYKKWFDDGRVMTGTYTNKTNEVTYIWYDSNKREIKKQKDFKKGTKWIMPE